MADKSQLDMYIEAQDTLLKTHDTRASLTPTVM